MCGVGWSAGVDISVRMEAMTNSSSGNPPQESPGASSSGSSAAPQDGRYDAGIAVRREVMGDAFVDAALERNAGTDGEEIQRHITETVWGSVWTRPGLEKRDRSLLNIGMLVALRATGELRGHVRGGLRNGLTRTEIREAIIHASGYCGAPAALSAMKVAEEVLIEELGPRGVGRLGCLGVLVCPGGSGAWTLG